MRGHGRFGAAVGNKVCPSTDASPKSALLRAIGATRPRRVSGTGSRGVFGNPRRRATARTRLVLTEAVIRVFELQKRRDRVQDSRIRATNSDRRMVG